MQVVRAKRNIWNKTIVKVATDTEKSKKNDLMIL
jgi:hypothetical protein